MAAKKHGYRAASAVTSAATKVSPPGTPVVRRARAVKRSITVQPDIDALLRGIAKGREYSQIASDAFILYVQARGIDVAGRELEEAVGRMTVDVEAEVQRRLEDARRRAKLRRHR
jgi:hypothetical protein